MDLILFPDVQAWAKGLLETVLASRAEAYTADVYVGTVIPRAKPPRMVLLRRDGGARLDIRRESARLTVRVFGATEDEAANLAAMVRAILGASADGKPVALVREMSGPVPIPDSPGKPAYRLMTFDLTVVGQPA